VRFGRIACPARAARFLGLQAADQCWEVLRTRSAGTIPSLLDLAIVPTTLAPLLSRTDLEGQASLYSLLDVRYGLQDSRDEQVLSVVVPLNEERTLLGLADGGRLVAVEGVSFTPSNLPFAYFRLLFDADRFAFRVDGIQASIVPVPRDSEIRPMRPMP
jgi:DNA-binding GntR family transcriptional regulator